MLYFDGTDVSERIDVNKTSAWKECNICHYWCFLNYSFRFQLNLCNRCHGLLMMSMNLNNIAILSIKCFGYRFIISLISKNETISLMQNADLTENSGTLLKLSGNLKKVENYKLQIKKIYKMFWKYK